MTTPISCAESVIALAERVEALTGPDRNCDAMIHHAIKQGVGTGYAADAPAYTASLDAAMTLVPEGWKLLALCQRSTFEIAEAKEQSVDPDEAAEWTATLRRDSEHPSYRLVRSDLRQSVGPAPALALTAAALRARASLEQPA